MNCMHTQARKYSGSPLPAVCGDGRGAGGEGFVTFRAVTMTYRHTQARKYSGSPLPAVCGDGTPEAGWG
jgi:hypothetical protein